MYEFKDIRKSSESGETMYRSNELYIDDETLTDQIEGYTQVSVTGSLLQPYEVESVQYLNRNGSEPLSQHKGIKEFTIKYIIYNDSRQELRDKYDKLQGILNGVHNISFRDDRDWYYQKVILTGAENPEENSHNVVGSFTLTAYDPKRYYIELSKYEVVELGYNGQVEAEGMQIEFEVDVEEPTIRIDNGLYETDFKLSGMVRAGTVVGIEIDQNTGRITSNGADIVLGSFPRGLTLYTGARAYVVGNTTKSRVLFMYREVKV